MRVEAPKRPTEDANETAAQQWRWMYKLHEQLNMVIEQLERANILDLSMPGFGSASADGLLSGSVAGNAADIEELRKEQENISTRLTDLNKELEDVASSAGKAVEATEVLEAQLGGMTVLIGTATIAFGTATHYVDIEFGKTFASKPVVFTNQVFNQHNLVSIVDYVTTTKFRVTAPAGVSTSNGTRVFNWLAIGELG